MNPPLNYYSKGTKLLRTVAAHFVTRVKCTVCMCTYRDVYISVSVVAAYGTNSHYYFYSSEGESVISGILRSCL